MQQAVSGRVARVWQRVADRESARLRDAFVHSESPALPLRAGLGQALAALVLLGYVGLIVLGGYAALLALGVVGAWPEFTRLLFGIGALSLLLFAWVARPRVPELPGLEVLAQDAPELHALIGRVAAALDVPVPGRVVLTPEVNAFMGVSGWRRTPTLGLGLGLWFGLRPQERVAVIAHELAHQRNGDPARGWVVGTALDVLGHAVSVLTPDWWLEARAEGAEVWSNLLLRLVAYVPLGLYTLIASLVGAGQQAAEFRADLMGARVAGSEATVSTLDRLHLASMFDSALHAQRYRAERPHVFLELRHQWDSVTPERWARLREERAAQGARLDASHPPTAHRIAVISAWPREAQVGVGGEAAGWMDAELAPFVAPLQHAALDDYRDRVLG